MIKKNLQIDTYHVFLSCLFPSANEITHLWACDCSIRQVDYQHLGCSRAGFSDSGGMLTPFPPGHLDLPYYSKAARYQLAVYALPSRLKSSSRGFGQAWLLCFDPYLTTFDFVIIICLHLLQMLSYSHQASSSLFCDDHLLMKVPRLLDCYLGPGTQGHQDYCCYHSHLVWFDHL